VCNCCGNGKDYTVEEAKEILQKMIDFSNDMFGNNDTLEDVFDEPKIADLNDVDFLKDWDDRWTEENVMGKLLIFSASDNTIPYELFNLIESKFDAWREHLG
jgi:hypothetical protein